MPIGAGRRLTGCPEDGLRDGLAEWIWEEANAIKHTLQNPGSGHMGILCKILATLVYI